MPPEARRRDVVECKTPEGRVLATVEIFARVGNAPTSLEQDPLISLPVEEAALFGEERLQLRERERYQYRLTPAPGVVMDLALSARGTQPSEIDSPYGQEGFIEPQDYCRPAALIVVRRDDETQRPLATGAVEVRSAKLGYRDHYRGMLSFIARQSSALLMDCRAPTQVRLDILWRQNTRVLEQQLEFLRHTVESVQFGAAVNEILRNPHRRMEDEREDRDISKPFKPDKLFVRQIEAASRRVPAPRTIGIESLPTSISVRHRTDFLDTAENRFAKMVLVEFRNFFSDVLAHLVVSNNRGIDRPDQRRLINDCTRLRALLDGYLSRGFFPEVSHPDVLPFASPVLQRKAGYRELSLDWLQFHAGSQLMWDGGTDVFHAGARDVATLYEYWLFFQLQQLFRQKFSCDQPLHAVVIDKTKVPPQLNLKRGVELKTPVSGTWSETAGRNLNAEFHFNRTFHVRRDRDHTRASSWTRAVRPDYTISVWPAEYKREEAEANELMVHIHFDAKYRVERVGEILGERTDDDTTENTDDLITDTQTAAKYDDLLKMHAYRDAIRRTAGAYVLYPGTPGDDQTHLGFHEVLPGLGAFAVRPDSQGNARGSPRYHDSLTTSSGISPTAPHLENG